MLTVRATNLAPTPRLACSFEADPYPGGADSGDAYSEVSAATLTLTLPLPLPLPLPLALALTLTLTLPLTRSAPSSRTTSSCYSSTSGIFSGASRPYPHTLPL